MFRKWMALMFIFLTSLNLFATLQGSVLNSQRSIDWTNAGVPGGIPTRNTVCTTLSPGTTPALIKSALQACPSGEVVMLNAGTYNFSTGVDFSGAQNVTLRGAGPDATFLVFTGSVGCETQTASVCLAGSSRVWTGNPGTVHNWTGGLSQGSTSLTFDSVSGWAVNQMLICDQLNDSADTGNIFVTDDVAYGQEGGSPGRAGPPDRNQQQFFKVTAIAGTTVTVSTPVYMPNWRSSQSPQCWSPGVVGGTVGSMLGMENLSIDSSGDGSSAEDNTQMANCYGCWVKNIRSLKANRNHIWWYQCARCQVQDSYFYGTKNAASQSYGIESFMTSDDLAVNNIFQQITASMMTGNNAGSVFIYNYSIDDLYNVATWMEQSTWTHDAGVQMVLYEGNQGSGLILDDIHGSADFVTAFRNRYLGWETGKTAHTNPFENMAYNRYSNVLANVLGEPSYHTIYQYSGSNADKAIYLLGYKGNQGTGTLDSLVASTLYRYGNYNTVNGSVIWNSAEVPTGLSLYAQSVPASETFPASFYYSSTPSWWNTNVPWPPIGPDVSGGDIANLGGHAYNIPAELCYIKEGGTSDGSGSALTYNADDCLSQTGNPPSPPTGVKATVH